MEILIPGLLAQTGLIEVRGKSAVECSEDIVRVSVTIAGESEPAYRGVALVTAPPSAGYRPWVVFANITADYAATARADPPCGRELIIEAHQGACATKADPDPTTL